MEHSIIIAFKEKDKVIVNHLRKLIETCDDTQDGIVGVEDRTVSLIPWEEKVWLDHERTGVIDSKVILLGKVKGSQSLLPVIDVKYNLHGITYGWAGTQAVISVDEKALRKREDYDAFLEDLRSITSGEIAEYERKDLVKKSTGKLWSVVLPVLATIFTTTIVVDAFKDRNKVHEQMLLFAVTHFYLNHMDTFIKE